MMTCKDLKIALEYAHWRLVMILVAVTLVGVLSTTPLLAEDSLVCPPDERVGKGGPEYAGGSHALLVGVSNYDNWQNLPNVGRYLKRMEAALRCRGFDVKLGLDLRRDEFMTMLTEFVIQHASEGNEDKRLLIYFMGHGATYKSRMTERYKGFIVLKDDILDLNERDKQRFIANAISMPVILDKTHILHARHVLLIFDSCFSGQAITSPGASMFDPDVQDFYKHVVQVITSGEAFQEVPAESMFNELLIGALTTPVADHDGDGLLTGTQLGYFLRTQLRKVSDDNQTPSVAKLIGNGEYVFQVPVSQDN